MSDLSQFAVTFIKRYVYFYLQDEIPKSIYCVAFLPSGQVVTGDTNGNLMLWARDSTDAFTCSIIMQAHNVS